MDRGEIREIVSKYPEARVNVLLLLLEQKPYRKTVFKQVLLHPKPKEDELEWQQSNLEEKTIWVKKIMLPRYTEEYLINHITRSIMLLKMSKNFKFAFEVALTILKDEITKKKIT